ncbi:MAG: hypothetical protein AAFU85_33095, partial [Planctomycetota bacterium]
DAGWDQSRVAAHLAGILIASGAQRSDVFELFDQYPPIYNEEHPFPSELGPLLRRLCERYDTSAATAMMALGNRDIESAVEVAWRWLDDRKAPVRYRRLAARALALGTDLGDIERRATITRLVSDEDAGIQRLGLDLATNQNSLQSKSWTYFGDSPSFPSFDEIGNEVDAKSLERFASGESVDEAALSIALQALAAPSEEHSLRPIIDYVARAPDDESRLELLFEVLFRRDREADLPTLKTAIGWMDKHLNEWQSRPIKQRVKQMRTKAAHDLVTIDESDNGTFWTF